MKTGSIIELVEITASVYEVGARIWLDRRDEFPMIDHALIVLPEPERTKFGEYVDYSSDYQSWYGELDNSPQSYPFFITKLPMIGLDFNHISEGISATDKELISGISREIGNIGVEETFHGFMPDIFDEVNADIDNMLDRLPLKNMWNEESKIHVFRFIIVFEYCYYQFDDYYSGGTEYDTELEWLGRISMASIINLSLNANKGEMK